MDYNADIKDTVAEAYLKQSIDVVKEIDDKDFGVYIAEAAKIQVKCFCSCFLINICDK